MKKTDSVSRRYLMPYYGYYYGFDMTYIYLVLPVRLKAGE